MKVEQLEDVTTIVADEGKCFKNSNIKTITTYIVLSKFDSIDNYEEVNIEDYNIELKQNTAKELLGPQATEQEIEARILEDSSLIQPSQPADKSDELERIISEAVDKALRMNR